MSDVLHFIGDALDSAWREAEDGNWWPAAGIVLVAVCIADAIAWSCS